MLLLQVNSRSKEYGRLDKGPAGITKFFCSHTCNALCRHMGLDA